MFQAYVLGFIFNASRDRVLMIRKNRPKWQAGRLNGVGGKVEKGETARQALVREVFEEAALTTSELQWRHYGVIDGTDFRVYCFETSVSDLSEARAMTDEALEVLDVDLQRIWREGQSNLAALVGTALDGDAPFLRLSYRELAGAEAANFDADQPH
jgi:8-oxo-dGTP diphosphatase